ncbi:hypothetical protein NDU88_004743 [Pleurodeles waltl]|uniref:Uncharacterized protein n=1 Tax=Pleurodeles waltl TaxID=8319 RepID=A0AAV7MUS0_PLEWA|nr:hypothetical protein NDU88_004743 [Pleurodeles waltl]
MEEDQVVEQQDDLERMIAHMRAEALKRSKDWLRSKMEDKGADLEGNEDTPTAHLNVTDNAGAPEHTAATPQKASKRQRSDVKTTRKPAKRAKVVAQDTEEDAAATPEASRPQAPAEGEHISALIKECIKLLAPLLMRGEGAGLGKKVKDLATERYTSAEGHRFQRAAVVLHSTVWKGATKTVPRRWMAKRAARIVNTDEGVAQKG